MLLAAIAFATMFAPLSSHIYTIEKKESSLTMMSWTEEYTSISAVFTTTKARCVFIDDPNDSMSSSEDIGLLALVREGNQLNIHVSLSHGEFYEQQAWSCWIGLDFDGDKVAEEAIRFNGQLCELQIYHYGKDGLSIERIPLHYELEDNNHTLNVELPIQQFGDNTSFYVWAELSMDLLEPCEVRYLYGYLYEKNWPSIPYKQSQRSKVIPLTRPYCIIWHDLDIVGYSEVNNQYVSPNPLHLEAIYATTNILYKTYTYISTISSFCTVTSTETHTLTEGVPLSYWHRWLPYPFFAGAGAAAITLCLSEAIPYIKSKRKKVAPEGARLVKLCPTCGVENPLDAEYCMECGAKL
jgi:ribosomal protein L40E